MNEEDNQLQLKQEIIKAEIIDKNYDKEKFFNFCIAKKEQGDDLAKWSLLELNDTIMEFIKQEEESTQIQPPQYQNKQHDLQIKVDINQFKLYQKSDDLNVNEREISCKKLERTVLNNKDVKVLIRNPKNENKINPYTSYEILTESMQWLVRRRFSDFEWLRSILVKCYPWTLVPPIPGKKIGNRRFEEDFIEKRMMFLQKFIDDVMQSETFKTSEALTAFLSMIDRNQFDSKMREMTTYQPSPYAEDLKTLSGKLIVLDDDNNEKYYPTIVNYFKLQGQLIDRLNYNFKNFYVNISAACTNSEEISKDFDTLKQLNAKVFVREDISKGFEELEFFFQNWNGILNSQNEIIKKYIKDYLKYSKMEGDAFSEIISNRQVLMDKYKNEYIRVKTKKEKLWQTMDYGKWEIIDEFNKIDRMLLIQDKQYAMEKMCTKDTQNLENIHKQIGHANKMCKEELKTLLDNNGKRLFENLKVFAEEFYPTLNDAISVWSSLNSFN